MALTLLVNLIVALGLTAVLIGVGARVRRVLRLAVPPSLRLACDFTLASALVASLVAALGLARLLLPSALTGLFVAMAAAARWRRNGWRFGPTVAPTLAALALLPVALAPPFFYDALIYHLGLPWQGLLEGAWSAHRETVYASSPPLFQFLAVFPLAAGLSRAPAALHLISFVLAGAAVDGLARRLGARRWAAALAAFALPLAPLHVLVPGLPAAEGFGTVAFVAALAILLWGGRRGGQPLLAGLLLGAGLAARIQLIPLIALAGLASLVWYRGVRATVQFGAGVAATSITWWLKNLVLLGSPLAPLGFAGAGANAMWQDAVSMLHLARGPVDFLHPFVSDLGPHASVLLPLALAAALRLVRPCRTRDALLAIVLVGGVCSWAMTAAIPRYLAPWIALLLAVAAAASATPVGRWAAGLALASGAALSAATTVGHVGRLGGLGLVTEDPTRVEARLVVDDPLPAFRQARTLPRTAFVAFVGEPRVFGFPRRALVPSYYDASPLVGPVEGATSVEGLAAALRSRGISHLLINWGELQRLAPRYPVLPFTSPEGGERFRTLLAACGAPVVRAGGVEVFALPDGPGR